jgi:hypothetical protein
MEAGESRQLSPGDPIGRVLAFAEATHARAVVLLVLVSLLSFLPGFFQVPPTDRDESRFAQATKQMIESGDYIDIRFQDEVRYKKPVGIYWLQAGAVRAGEALGIPKAQTRIWLYRLPSLFGAIGAVLATYCATLRLPGGADVGRLDPAECRGAHRQDRRHAAVHRHAGGGRAGARLFPAGRRQPAGICRRGGVLDRARRRRAAEGPGDPADHRTDGSQPRDP